MSSTDNPDDWIYSASNGLIGFRALPKALQNVYLACNVEKRLKELEVPFIHLNELSNLTSKQSKVFQLLLHREKVTSQLAKRATCWPPLILERARIYEALQYDDLAAFDAFVVYTLCQKYLCDEFVTDLEAHTQDGQPWVVPSDNDQEWLDATRRLKLSALAILIRCLCRLGATQDANIKRVEFESDLKLLSHTFTDAEEWPRCSTPFWTNVFGDGEYMASFDRLLDSHQLSRFGLSRREIYPWSLYEPSRNTPDSVHEINEYLSTISSYLEVKITALPAFDSNGVATTEKSYQLGLFAKKDLEPRKQILAEKSILTAIRPLEDAICDACGQDLEGISFEEIRQCEGDDCDITFCSEECKQRAVEEYHRPATAENDESEEEGTDAEVLDDEDDTGRAEDTTISAAHEPSISTTCNVSATTDRNYSPSGIVSEETESVNIKDHLAPFCGNTDLSNIGRSTNTETPEWDLYFLLLTRAVAMSTTQNVHPLNLPEIKYLWGDFNPSPLTTSASQSSHPRTLPFSLHHNLQLPLDFFTTLSLTAPSLTPYSRHWLENYDLWIQQTLHAKFRGVANATQSTFDGKPEVAAVHPGWCLANHSCAPNVRWTPKGVRRFFVRTKEERNWAASGSENVDEDEDEGWAGIKAGEEIFSHYTDVRLPVGERRERLREVLGGNCRCERCVRESGES